MFPLTEENKHVAQLLFNSGTCPRCIFRFCRVDLHTPYKLPSEELFRDLERFLKTEKDELILEVPNPPPKKIRLQELEDGIDNLSENAEGGISVTEDENTAAKHSSSAVCNVCLGLLQEFCEKEFIKKVCQKVETSGFEFTNLVLSVSFPPQLSVREHAAWLLVKQEMGKQSLSLGRNDVIQLKEAYKWISHPLFAEELGVPIDGKSLFEVSVVFAHPETVEDCHFLGEVCPDCFKPAKNKQSVFTRIAVLKALNKIKEDDFLKQFPGPPNSPKTACTVLEIECAHGAVFVAGKMFCLGYPSPVNFLSFLNTSAGSSSALFTLLLGSTGCPLRNRTDRQTYFSSANFLQDPPEICYLTCHAKGNSCIPVVCIRDG